MPGRVLVGFEAGAGEQGRRTADVDGRVVAGTGRIRVVELDPGADVRAAARRLADRPGVAFAEPDWVRRVDACDPEVCWHLQPRPGANVVAAHDDDHRGGDRTVAVVDTGVMAAVPDNPATPDVDESDDLDLGDRVAARWHCRDTGCVEAVAAPTSSHGTEVASVTAAADDDDGTTGVAPEATVVSYRVDATGDRIPQYPVAFPGVISVGATDDGGEIADFSS